MERKKQVGWRISEDLHRTIKMAAAKRGCSMAALLEAAVLEYLAKLPQEKGEE